LNLAKLPLEIVMSSGRLEPTARSWIGYQLRFAIWFSGALGQISCGVGTTKLCSNTGQLQLNLT